MANTVRFKDPIEPAPDYSMSGRSYLGMTTQNSVRPDDRHKNTVHSGVRVLPTASRGDLGVTALDNVVSAYQRHGQGTVQSRGASMVPEILLPGQGALEMNDLSKMAELNVENIALCLEKRFLEDAIYTNCGEILLSVNPFKPLPIYSDQHQQTYSEGPRPLSPHLFSVSARAYRQLRDGRVNQIILVSGESGSGKTEATKYMIQHLMSIGRSTYSVRTLQDKIIRVNPLLEAFGNAKTSLNDNSSRFGKFLRLSFSTDDGTIRGARIKDYMLEKTRVVRHGKGEGTFHVFYALLAGADNPTLEGLGLDRKHRYRITGGFLGQQRGGEGYRQMYQDIKDVFRLIELDEDEVQDIHSVLAAVILTGDIRFEDGDHDSVLITNEDVVEKVANLLELDMTSLTTVLIQRRGVVGKEVINFSKKRRRAEEERDALAKSLYDKLFGWLIWKINESLTFANWGNRKTADIGILDICGFEDLKDNNFEQLCINLVNEQLQNFMNLKVIEEEQSVYVDEGIMAAGELDIAAINNNAIINMFLQKNGILDMIDEDSKIEISKEESLVVKLGMKFGSAGIFVPTDTNRAEFSIHHFAGKVKYSAEGFLAKNTDCLPDMIRDCLTSSKSTFVNDLFMASETTTGTISRSQYRFRGSYRAGDRRPVVNRTEQNLSMSINTSTRDIFVKRFGNEAPQIKMMSNSKRNTHITYLKNSLEDLLSVMKQSEPHFVRCIKPNDKMEPNVFQGNRVQTQLKYNGVVEVARIRQTAYPIRYSASDFITKFRDLVGEGKPVTPQAILASVRAHPSDCRVGKSQVFMRESVQSSLSNELAALRKRREEEKARQMAENQRIGVSEDSQESHTLTGMTGGAGGLGLGATTRTFRSPGPALSVIDEGLQPPSSSGSVYNSTQSEQSVYPSGQGFTPEDPPTETEDNEQTEYSPPTTKAWDMFSMLTVEEERVEVDKQPILMCIKVLVYMLFFLLVFIALVCQKVSLIALISDLNQNEANLTTGTKRKVDDTKTLAYILLLIAICVPYGLALLTSLAKFCFGTYEVPSLWTWIWALLMEMLHSVGLTLLVFRVLPTLDSVRAVMLLAGGALLPSVLKFLASSPDLGVSTSAVNTVKTRIIDLLVLLVQLSVIPLLMLMHFFPDAKGHSYGALGWHSDNVFFNDPWHLVEMLGAFILVSFGYWENFVDGRFLCLPTTKSSWLKNSVLKIRYELQEGRFLLYSVVYLVKAGLTIWLAFQLRGNISLDYSNAFRLLTWDSETPTSVTAIITVTISGAVAFIGCFLACVFQMQTVCMFLPSVLAAPAAVAVIILDCEHDFLSVVTTSRTACPQGPAGEYWYHYAICVAWWLALLVLCRHVAKPQMDRNANMEKLFISPCYCGVFTGESNLLNRRRNTRKVRMIETARGAMEVVATTYELAKLKDDEDVSEDDPEAKREDLSNHVDGLGESKASAFTPMLYACATMWHETRAEMVQLLKSIHRLDKEYAYRKFLAEEVGGYDPDFYNFETHILFDDAMELNDDNEPVPNRWVQDLVGCMTEACSSVHEMPMKLHEPLKVDTPYGGQLIWKMPGGTLLFVHLKDLNKIRNRKRWSQVMYMYYLLGFKLVMDTKESILKTMIDKVQSRDGGGLNISELNSMLGEAHAYRMANTFLLALDGDMDFSPGAVRILLDRMRDEKVGAACGRIHPIGSGLLVWYQIFEYAIGHWLQKAAEHVFGCVLCSPGCFSLFRAAALMDTNVMKRYTIEATLPTDHLQFDQGEDRWLCTLLLQQGYRIEYAAAADAFTYVPEGFFEFYNQRRRWMPSTIANILDLLASSGRTTKVNPNLSRPYMLYQWMLMLMTILGPGTILMMIAGAMKLVFTMTQVDSYLFATIPTIVYIIVCFWMKSQTQLIFAAVLSVFYSFIMLVVFVGTLVTIGTESIFHPSVLVIVLLVSIFLFAAACHPQEFHCIVHGFLYLIVIPSAYLLLVIYSILNLNDVSWGTREVPTKAQILENERKKKEKEEEKKRKKDKGFFARIFNRGEENIRELTNLVKTLMPDRQQPPTSKQQQDAVMTSWVPGLDPRVQSPGYADQNLIDLLTKIEFNTRMLIEKGSGELSSVLVSQPSTSNTESLGHDHKPSIIEAVSRTESLQHGNQPATQPEKQTASPATEGAGPPKKAVTMANLPIDEPVWLSHSSVGRGKVIKLNTKEKEFWEEFVSAYLLPIRPTPAQREATAKGLKDLRNSAALGLIILNTMWMAVNFMFQLTEAAKITIPFTTTEESALGLSFVILLLALMLLQTLGMAIHRVGTLRHLLAITKISFGKASGHARERYLRFVSSLMKLELEDDPGAVTQAPELCVDDENAFGKTVKGSTFHASQTTGRTRFALSNTIREGSRLLAISHHARLDPHSKEVWEAIQSTMKGADNPSRMESSFRPLLPPRRQSTKKFAPGQHLTFTQKELEHAHLSTTPGPRFSHRHRDVDEMGHLSAIGKSLYLRTRICNDHMTSGRQHYPVEWEGSDLPNHDRIMDRIQFEGTRF